MVPLGLHLIHKRNTNALREYKQTITLNPMQKEVNALRAPLWVLYWETPVYLYKMENPGPRVRVPEQGSGFVLRPIRTNYCGAPSPNRVRGAAD